MSLRDKTVFISGGSRGICLQIALRAARDGANVALIAKTAEPHPKLPAPCSRPPPGAQAHRDRRRDRRLRRALGRQRDSSPRAYDLLGRTRP
jgi:NAD(P)-dependent dehydrogenase (short-subunit alcohol dehydrogenase family)